MPEITPEERIVCDICGEEYESGEIERDAVVDNPLVCAGCYEEYCFTCDDCGGRFHDEQYRERGGRGVCDSCSESYIECGECGRYTYEEDAEYDEDGILLCAYCERERGARVRNTPDIGNIDLQTTDKGKIIKSPRKFGIELETVFDKTDSVQKLAGILHPAWGFKGDGSIRMHKNAIGTKEIVSPIMSGKKGEEEVNKLAKNAYKLGFSVNSSCGYHAHFDAPEFKRNPKRDEEVLTEARELRKVIRFTADGEERQTPYNPYEWERLHRMAIDTPNLVQNVRLEEEEANISVRVNKGPEFQRARNLIYVYVAFDDVFRAMQPPSRRHNNFCKATANLYSLDTIRDLDDYSELEAMWYKVDRRRKLVDQIKTVDNLKRGKDGSRYSGINFEPLFRNNSQTLEIRYHSPTLNAEKILRWIDLHQTIIDHVAKKELNLDRLHEILARETHLLKKAKAMCEMFGVRKETEKYVLQRLAKFNRLAPDEETEDEEVEKSEIGRPSQAHERLRMRGQENQSPFSRIEPVEALVQDYVARITNDNPFN